MSEGPLTYDDLAERWRCCPRQAKRICRRLALEPMRLGHRTVQFRPADVDRAEERATKFKQGGKKAA
jgi:hypothetical protein